MEIKNWNRCIKIDLPNGKVVDILSPVIAEIKNWLQDTAEKNESGGYIVGYQHNVSGNISLEAISHPYSLDKRSPIRFYIHDPRHSLFLKRAKRRKSYYMGVWHTHPQRIPIPSAIDWEDWRATMQEDKTGCQYVFFFIAGTDELRVWVGDFLTGKIVEVYESPQNVDGIYYKRKNDE